MRLLSLLSLIPLLAAHPRILNQLSVPVNIPLTLHEYWYLSVEGNIPSTAKRFSISLLSRCTHLDESPYCAAALHASWRWDEGFKWRTLFNNPWIDEVVVNSFLSGTWGNETRYPNVIERAREFKIFLLIRPARYDISTGGTMTPIFYAHRINISYVTALEIKGDVNLTSLVYLPLGSTAKDFRRVPQNTNSQQEESPDTTVTPPDHQPSLPASSITFNVYGGQNTIYSNGNNVSNNNNQQRQTNYHTPTGQTGLGERAAGETHPSYLDENCEEENEHGGGGASETANASLHGGIVEQWLEAARGLFANGTCPGNGSYAVHHCSAAYAICDEHLTMAIGRCLNDEIFDPLTKTCTSEVEAAGCDRYWLSKAQQHAEAACENCQHSVTRSRRSLSSCGICETAVTGLARVAVALGDGAAGLALLKCSSSVFLTPVCLLLERGYHELVGYVEEKVTARDVCGLLIPTCSTQERETRVRRRRSGRPLRHCRKPASYVVAANQFSVVLREILEDANDDISSHHARGKKKERLQAAMGDIVRSIPISSWKGNNQGAHQNEAMYQSIVNESILRSAFYKQFGTEVEFCVVDKRRVDVIVTSRTGTKAIIIEMKCSADAEAAKKALLQAQRYEDLIKIWHPDVSTIVFTAINIKKGTDEVEVEMLWRPPTTSRVSKRELAQCTRSKIRLPDN